MQMARRQRHDHGWRQRPHLLDGIFHYRETRGEQFINDVGSEKNPVLWGTKNMLIDKDY